MSSFADCTSLGVIMCCGLTLCLWYVDSICPHPALHVRCMAFVLLIGDTHVIECCAKHQEASQFTVGFLLEM